VIQAVWRAVLLNDAHSSLTDLIPSIPAREKLGFQP
jgi:hypothetical protein